MRGTNDLLVVEEETALLIGVVGRSELRPRRPIHVDLVAPVEEALEHPRAVVM